MPSGIVAEGSKDAVDVGTETLGRSGTPVPGTAWRRLLGERASAARLLALLDQDDTVAAALTREVRLWQTIALGMGAAMLPARWSRLRATATTLPLATASIDLILCDRAIHHFTAPIPPLRECRRVCRRGGLIAICERIADEDAQRAAEQNAIERLRDPAHIWSYPPSELAAILRSVGLTIRSAETTTVLRDADEWLASAGAMSAAVAIARDQLIATIADDRAGLAPIWTEGHLQIAERLAWVIAEVPGGKEAL